MSEVSTGRVITGFNGWRVVYGLGVIALAFAWTPWVLLALAVHVHEGELILF